MQKKPNMYGATWGLHYPSQLLPSYRGWLLSICTASHCELMNLCQELLAYCRKYSLGRVCQSQERPPQELLTKQPGLQQSCWQAITQPNDNGSTNEGQRRLGKKDRGSPCIYLPNLHAKYQFKSYKNKEKSTINPVRV